MPEGDTIWRAAAAIRERVSGQQVRSAGPERLLRLAGSRLRAVDAIGKHLVLGFDNGWSLHTHMRMTGSWHLYRPGQKWHQPLRRAGAVLEFEDWTAVLFAAPVVDLLPTAHLDLRHLGPDILDPAFDADVAVRRARQLQPPTLGEMLLDQRIAAGIGNVYKCEALWELHLDPWRQPAAESDARLRLVFLTARQLMLPNLQGSFRRRFPAAGGARQAAVHGRTGRPCPRCGTRIVRRAQGEQARQTYYCPACQRADAPSPGRAELEAGQVLFQQ